MSGPADAREALDAREAPDAASGVAPAVEPAPPEPPPDDAVLVVEPAGLEDGPAGDEEAADDGAGDEEAGEQGARDENSGPAGGPMPSGARPGADDAPPEGSREDLPPDATAVAAPAGAVATGEGFLDELPIPDEPSGLPEPARRELERGVYEVVGRDARGRELAIGPDGQEVVLAAYPPGVAAARALYPHPMLPPLLDSGQASSGGAILAHARPAGRSLEDALLAGLRGEAVSAAVDLARFNRYLGARGVALVGLDPRDVLLGPTRLARLPLVRRVGEAAPAEAPRGGPPERAAGLPVTGDEGSFALGALLYRALDGRELAEGELPTEFPPVPGAPQALSALLAPAGSRAGANEALEPILSLERALRPRPHWEVAAASTVGVNGERPVNEDSCGWARQEALFEAGPESLLLACVADGMGGMAGGEVASRAAVESFLEPEPRALATPQALAERVAAANSRVTEALSGRSGGCTFTGLVADGTVVALGHVGDTRAYRLSAGAVTQLTEDHSVVAMLVKMGLIEAQDAHGHPDSNKVTRALGSVREFPADYVQTLELRLAPGDRLVLVSDGVWGPFPPGELEARLLADEPARALADGLVRGALRLGTTDNATALVVEYRELEPLG